MNLQHENTLVNRIREYESVAWAGLALTTVTRYRMIMDQFELWLGSRQPTVAVWHEWIKHLTERGIDVKTMQKSITLVRGFFRWCEECGYIDRTPCRGRFRLPPDKPRPRLVFTVEQYEAMKAACTGRLAHMTYPLVVASWATGASMKDVCLLTWDSVDLDGMCVHIARHKTLRHGCEQDVPIMPNSDWHQLLLSAKAPGQTPFKNYVFPDLAVRYESSGPTHITQALRNVFHRANIPTSGPMCRSHRHFRHAFASSLINGGVDCIMASKMTGHKNLATLRSYYKYDPAALAEAYRKAFEKKEESLLRLPHENHE